MDRHARIDIFSLAAHRPAVERLLRSVSPLGRFISVAERNSLLRQALEAA